jgi:sigma-B regulation protein RsbU (phosphoserine phosphatase)
MKELSRYSDPQEMYQVFSRRMAQLFPVARQLSLSRRGLQAPNFRVTRFSQWKEAVNPWKDAERLPVHSGGLLADLLYGDQARLIDDLSVPADDPAAEYLAGQRSLLAIPHFDGGSAPNMVVLTREEPGAFPRERIPDLVLLSNLFGRVNQTLVLSGALRDAYKAVEYELQTIADIQKSLLPDQVPDVPGLDVAVHYQMAERAGGDYYDFFKLPNGCLGVLIADASGHGAPSAVLMAVAHSIVHTRPDPPLRPGELLTHLNSHLTRRYTRHAGSFVTAFYAVFDPRNGELAYASAGHTPPRLLRSIDNSKVPLNRAQRLPLGIKADEVYPEQRVLFFKGDQVAFFTDGVIEATDATGDMFGTERIDERLNSAPSAADSLAEILTAWTEFTSNSTPADDRTMVVVKRV